MNIFVSIVLTAIIIWYWGESDAAHKDNLFYIYLVSSQIGFLIMLHRFTSISNELNSLKGVRKEVDKDEH